MPYCRQCGRLLQDGEVCNCISTNSADVKTDSPAQQQNNFGSTQQQPYQNSTPQYQGQPYPQQGFAPNGYPYPYYGQPMPPQKKSKTWILAIIISLGIVLLIIIAILAAILIPSMLGYTKKSRMSSENSLASNIYKATNTALVEMDEEGIKTSGLYIICSDESKNMNVPFDASVFNEHFKRYAVNEKLEKSNYFIVVNNGVAEYTAVSEDWSSTKKPVGTYPSSTIDGTRIYTSDGSYSLSTESKTLTYLYTAAQEAIVDIQLKKYREDQR